MPCVTAQSNVIGCVHKGLRDCVRDFNRQLVSWRKAGQIVREFGNSHQASPASSAIEFESIAKAQFNDWVNTQLPAQRDGRCMIPQPDGSFKECPRKNGTNHPACKDCSHQNEYERKDKAVISVESLEDEFGYSAATAPSVEDEYIDMETLSEAQRAFLRKMEQLIEVSPKHGLALLLMAMGINGAEFADRLQLGHDAANVVRQQVTDLAPDRINGLSQIYVEGLKANQSKRSEYYREEANRILDTVLKMYFDC